MITREQVVAEAMTWEHTPYVANARVKGRNGGVDCLTFIAGVYEATGVIPPQTIPRYSKDWHLHQTEELYLDGISPYCYEIFETPLPGDLVMWKFGHTFSHSAIVLNWPRIIHAWGGRPVGPDDALRKTFLTTIHEVIALRGTPRLRRYFRPKVW